MFFLCSLKCIFCVQFFNKFIDIHHNHPSIVEWLWQQKFLRFFFFFLYDSLATIESDVSRKFYYFHFTLFCAIKQESECKVVNTRHFNFMQHKKSDDKYQHSVDYSMSIFNFLLLLSNRRAVFIRLLSYCDL